MNRKLFLSILGLKIFSLNKSVGKSDVIFCVIHTNRVCGTCKDGLSKTIYLQKGVKDVKIDTQQNNIKIYFDETKTSEEQLKKIIVKNGFDADEMKSDVNKRQILRDCCFSNIQICK